MNKHKFSYNDDRHEYKIDGRVVPGVTQILSAVFPYRYSVEPWYLGRGKANHACYAMLARGEVVDCDPACTPYVQAWRAWRIKERIEDFTNVELPVYSHRYQYGGTLDATCMVPDPWTATILDYKGSITPRAKWQLAAYAIAYEETTGKESPRFGAAVELREDGRYKVECFDLKDARREWLNIRSVYALKQRDWLLD